MAKLTREEIIAALKEMTVVELNDLVKAVEEEFGVTAAAPVMGGAPVEEEAVAKGPSEVSLILKACGPQKVAVIKAVQAITGLGLMDAKKVVDAAPSPIKEHISPVEAEEHKKVLVAAGAEVEIK
ncbi:MAG: 50S ribosomal protein L7/L12 [Erysipelotrichia bacterium]|jgi:large subunit ribosomal protein L7/L12|nr:50S ribosomal protein L7/L12 [Bacilli bacterium]NLB49791.1 50S ribosomal protein L7/L12 [Erysipelotrichia bacterium]